MHLHPLTHSAAKHRGYSLGDTAARSRAYLLDYYQPRGEIAERLADSALRSPEVIGAAVDEYGRLGFDELVFVPTVSDPDQVDLLAQALPR